MARDEILDLHRIQRRNGGSQNVHLAIRNEHRLTLTIHSPYPPGVTEDFENWRNAFDAKVIELFCRCGNARPPGQIFCVEAKQDNATPECPCSTNTPFLRLGPCFVASYDKQSVAPA